MTIESNLKVHMCVFGLVGWLVGWLVGFGGMMMMMMMMMVLETLENIRFFSFGNTCLA